MGRFGDRLNDSYNSRNDGGARNGILDWSKLDERPKFYKIKEGPNKIDIIPYIIKSANHPLVKAKKLKIGDMDYMLDIWVHKSIGPSETDVVCLKKNYGKACPLCDKAEEYRKLGQTDENDALKSKRRVFYNIRDVMNPDEGLLVLEQSHFKFEKELIEQAKSSADNGGLVDYADPDEGKTISFNGAKGTAFKGKSSLEPKGFNFRDRKEAVGKLYKQAISFDDLLILHTADEMEALLTGEEDGDDEAPARRPTRHNQDEDDEDEKPARKPAKDEDDEYGERHQTPAKKPTEDEDDGKPRCPKGHRFGKDNDEFPEDCEECPQWKPCAKAQ